MKRILLIIVCVLCNIACTSQVNQEQEIFFNKPKNEVKTYNNEVVDQKATFKGGESELFKFYKNNSQFKVKDFEVPSKSVYFNLYINEKGEVYDYKIIKSIGTDYDEEVVRLISLMPKWKPAINKKKQVKVVILDYITFD
ncbi:energy transducer TonB [Aquimarina latercula]|uniref:energy transducer TonB n=1 Tax=Aquimarina latercula TaxID=987 RepID=UPI00041244D9|nr:energy transducer TonB [Aquimarina latercula]